MLNLAQTLRRLEKLTIDNSPEILTAIGVTGTVATAYLTGKASIKAVVLVRAEQERIDRQTQGYVLERKDFIKLSWKLYIPAVTTGAFTIAAIIGANHVNTRRATAMAAAYSITERAFSEYKDKVVEKIGEQKERSYRDEIAQDRVTRDPVSERTVVITDGGDVLCYEHFTGRYFKSSMEALKKAQNDINYQILNQGYASVGDLFDLIGLAPTSYSEEVGWNTDRMLDMVFSTTMSDDGRPCIAIDFDLSPNRKYSHFAGE